MVHTLTVTVCDDNAVSNTLEPVHVHASITAMVTPTDRLCSDRLPTP